MRKKTIFLLYALIMGLLVLSSSCKKEDDFNLPVLTTTEVTEITPFGAETGGNVTNEGSSPVTISGVCWSTEKTPTTSDTKTMDHTGLGSFSSTVYNLEPSTTYYVRAYATNSYGTGYGKAIQFTTLDGVKDASGNVYKIVKIGTQTWMAENLRTIKYNDGTLIPLEFTPQTTPGLYWYDNDETTYGYTYGALYNWYAVNTKKLCPTGWHVPTHEEWVNLTNSLGGPALAADKLKEAGTNHWNTPNTGATNESGFTALPGGFLKEYGEPDPNGDIYYYYLWDKGYWWTSTPDGETPGLSIGRYMTNSSSAVLRNNFNQKYGFSVRCVKD